MAGQDTHTQMQTNPFRKRLSILRTVNECYCTVYVYLYTLHYICNKRHILNHNYIGNLSLDDNIGDFAALKNNLLKQVTAGDPYPTEFSRVILETQH